MEFFRVWFPSPAPRPPKKPNENNAYRASVAVAVTQHPAFDPSSRTISIFADLSLELHEPASSQAWQIQNPTSPTLDHHKVFEENPIAWYFKGP